MSDDLDPFLARYKDYNTPSKASELSDVKLSAAGISDKEDRKLVLDAFHKAGYVFRRKAVTKKEAIEKNIASGSNSLPSSSAVCLAICVAFGSCG